MTKVLVVVGHPLLRGGVKAILNAQPDLAVVAEAATGQEALQRAGKKAVDIGVLMEWLPDPSGLQVLRRFKRRCPNLRLVVVPAHADGEGALRALQQGAEGCVAEHAAHEELAAAVRSVAAGQRYLSADLAKRLAFAELHQRAVQRLSARERQVVALMASGRTLTAIAQELGLHPKTVTTYRRRALDKFGINSNGELLQIRLENPTNLTGSSSRRTRSPAAP